MSSQKIIRNGIRLRHFSHHEGEDQERVLSFDLCVTDAKIHATPDFLFSLCILSKSNYMKQVHFFRKAPPIIQQSYQHLSG